MPVDMAVILVGICSFFGSTFMIHSSWYSQGALSSPSIILSGGLMNDGNRYIIDDFREAYYWLRQNTPKDSKILAWWDYGYQITGMSNRTVIVDNNTWNNTHIATVGKFMAANEEDGHEQALALDANYALVIFGGYSGLGSDD